MSLSDTRKTEHNQLQELLSTLKQLNHGGNFLEKVKKCISIAEKLTEKENDIENDELPFSQYLTKVFVDLNNGTLPKEK